MRGMLIESSRLAKGALKDEVVIVTGAGRGIGFEAARSLLWLGARVVLAELNDTTGKAAIEALDGEFGRGRALFARTDVGNERDVDALARLAEARFGRIDAVLNNATIAPIGPVTEVAIAEWDRSFSVNLRGPVLLARRVLPDMLERKHGAHQQDLLRGFEKDKAKLEQDLRAIGAWIDEIEQLSSTLQGGKAATN